MNLRKLKAYNPVRKPIKFITAVLIVLMPVFLYPQGGVKLDIYKLVNPDSPIPDSLFIDNIKKYINDTLFFGGGNLSNIQYYGNPKGVGLFRTGLDIGFSNGVILSNGWVGTATMDGGFNKNGHQALPGLDSLGPSVQIPDGPPALRDIDMDFIAGLISAPPIRPDTGADPSVITFKFMPYYNSIHLTYVFASEEYKWEQPPFPPPSPDPQDVDLTGNAVSDFMGIMVKKYPSEMSLNNIASLIGRDATPSWVPISVKYLNQTSPPGYYVPNYDKSVIFDGMTIPFDIFPFRVYPEDIIPCRNYWIKIGVADYPNDIVQGGYNLSHQINSAVFLKAYSLMSGSGLEWTFEGAIDNPDFASDSLLIEGGCSNLNLVIKFNIPPSDTMFLRMRIDNAEPGTYTITPPLLQDSLIMIPDSLNGLPVMEYPMTITALDDGILEGTEPWYIRYTLNPCDVPTVDTTGIGQAIAGYSGLIKVKVRDYYPFNDTTVSYGPNLPPPASQYHCGGDVTVTIADILTGGIPPFSYQWTNPPGQFGSGTQFTTTIQDSPDYAYCTITDRCTGKKPTYVAGKDTVVIYSKLTVEAFPTTFQLCQNGHTIIKVRNTNVGRFFSTKWYFQGNLVGSDSIYDVTWAEYGQYAPSNIDFICNVTDECGNTDSDTVHASFFPVVAIQGVPLICIGDTIHLTCTPANSYQWYYDSYPGTPIPGATFPDLFYKPTTPGNHTICVSIINECGEQADTCFTFFVSQLICEMVLNNSPTDFTVCPNVPFTLKELNGYDGWEWSWTDNGPHTATGQTITLSMTVAGDHVVQVTAYNINGCYNTITRTVTVHPYSAVQAFKDPPSVCIGNPAQLSATTGPVTISYYVWSANPPDPSLTGQQNNATPTVFPHVTTTYQCKIKDNNGCWDSTTVTVDVRERLAVNIFADPDSICTDKPVQLNFQSIVAPLPGATFNWTFDDGVPSTSTLSQPPLVVWSNPGLKDIYLTIEESGCDSTFHFQYIVNPDPVAGFSASNNTGCQPVEASFTNGSSNLENPVSYLWDFGDGTTDNSVNPTHLYPDPGNYNVKLKVTNSTGCVDSLTINDIVEVYAVPVAKFSADPQAATIDNPTINFTEEIDIPYAIIDWDFGDSTNTSGIPNPRHTYGAPGTYYVVMYTETEHGCWDRDTLEIGIVEDIKIFVPNAFTPNGDGLNDCFSIGGTTGDIVNVFRIIVYSRWGKQIYDAPVSNPDCIWDGRDMQGNIVPADSYVFRIFGQNARGAKKVYEGMVTVVK
jgi:gliding motility-associated-like protein